MRLTLTTLFLLVLVIPSFAQNNYGKELPIIADYSPNVAEEMHKSWKKTHSDILSNQWAWNSDYGDLMVSDAVFAISDQNFSVYVGGRFEKANGAGANRIAKFENGNFSPLGEGLADGSVYSILVIDDDDIYAAGNFTHAGNITVNNVAHWDGSKWESLGTGTDSTVLALGRYGNYIYCGGNFKHAGGIEANYIAKWSIDSKQWEPVMDGTVNGVNGGVSALAPNDKGLVVGGGFSHAGKITVNKVALLLNGEWVEMDGGVKGINSYVSCIRPAGCGDWNSDGSYWIGGVFDSTGTIEVGNVAHWNHPKGRWENGAKVNGPVYTINDVCYVVFVGGQFTKINNDDANNIGALDFPVDLAGGVDNTVFAMTGYWPPTTFTSTSNPLYVGGVFQNAGGNPSQNFGIYYGPSSSVRTDEPNIKSLRAYPTPATTSVTVQLPDDVSSLIVTDVVGRTVKQLLLNQSESINIDVSNLPIGMYNVIVNANNGISVAQITVAR